MRTGSSPYSERYVRNDVLGSLSLQRQDQPIDVAGHGTHLAGIVLQLAPDAKLCIGRVLEKKKKEEYEPGENLDANKTAKRVALVWKCFPTSPPLSLQRKYIDFHDRPSFMLSKSGK